MDKFREIVWRQAVESFVGEQQHMQVNPLPDWEPVQGVHDGSDVVVFASSCHYSCSGVLDELKLVDESVCEAGW